MPRDLGPSDHVRASHSNRPDPFEIVARCPLCSGAEARDIRDLAGKSHLAHAERGQRLWEGGDPAWRFAMIASGLLRMTRLSPHGREVTVEVLGPGCVAGILATCTRGPYPLSATALTGLWYLDVPNEAWAEAMRRAPALKDSLIHHLSLRWLHGLDLMAALMSAGVEQRLAHALLEIEAHQDAPGEPIAITRQTLAEVACTTVESAIRTTSGWQRRGWLRTGHRCLTVLNRVELVRLTQAPKP